MNIIIKQKLKISIDLIYKQKKGLLIVLSAIINFINFINFHILSD